MDLSQEIWLCDDVEFALAPSRLAGYIGARIGARQALSEPTTQLPDERVLLRAVAAQDAEAFRQLYERHRGLLFALALKILGNRTDAEDVLQETFVQVWKTAKNFDERRANAQGWLIMLTRSRAIDRLRARATRARITGTLDDPVSDPSPVAEQVAAGETRQVIRQALVALPAEQRGPIELAYFNGLTQTEIAAHLGEPLGTIKTRIRTGMLRLREQLGGPV